MYYIPKPCARACGTQVSSATVTEEPLPPSLPLLKSYQFNFEISNNALSFCIPLFSLIQLSAIDAKQRFDR